MSRESIKVFLKKKNVFAVVGASRNPRKYGYQVYKDLKNAGYEVYPVKPNVGHVMSASIRRRKK